MISYRELTILYLHQKSLTGFRERENAVDNPTLNTRKVSEVSERIPLMILYSPPWVSEVKERMWLMILYLLLGELQRFQRGCGWWSCTHHQESLRGFRKDVVDDLVLTTRRASEVSERMWLMILYLLLGEPQRFQRGCGWWSCTHH